MNNKRFPEVIQLFLIFFVILSNISMEAIGTVRRRAFCGPLVCRAAVSSFPWLMPFILSCIAMRNFHSLRTWLPCLCVKTRTTRRRSRVLLRRPFTLHIFNKSHEIHQQKYHCRVTYYLLCERIVHRSFGQHGDSP